ALAPVIEAPVPVVVAVVGHGDGVPGTVAALVAVRSVSSGGGAPYIGRRRERRSVVEAVLVMALARVQSRWVWWIAIDHKAIPVVSGGGAAGRDIRVRDDPGVRLHHLCRQRTCLAAISRPVHGEHFH